MKDRKTNKKHIVEYTRAFVNNISDILCIGSCIEADKFDTLGIPFEKNDYCAFLVDERELKDSIKMTYLKIEVKDD
jgi:hypothetical protein